MATRKPGLTKTQALRQARSSALVKQYTEKKETVEQPQREPSRRRKIASTHEPKKIDFTKPGLTKAMLARKKHAEQIKKDYARKKEEESSHIGRRPKRTAAPIGGDARFVITSFHFKSGGIIFNFNQGGPREDAQARCFSKTKIVSANTRENS